MPTAAPTPTPQPTVAPQASEHLVGVGDTLSNIAARYGTTVAALMAANNLTDPNLLSEGQTLVIPHPTPQATGSAFKIIPDSELIYGPMSITLDIDQFAQTRGGYLADYTEVVDGETLTGRRLDSVNTVSFGGTPATITFKSPTMLKVTVPAHAAGAPSHHPTACPPSMIVLCRTLSYAMVGFSRPTGFPSLSGSAGESRAHAVPSHSQRSPR